MSMIVDKQFINIAASNLRNFNGRKTRSLTALALSAETAREIRKRREAIFMPSTVASSISAITATAG